MEAVRADLADVDLADRVFAPHYARAISRKLVVASELLASPAAGSEPLATLTTGSRVDVFDISGGWAWGRADKRVGYVRADAIGPA